MEDLHDVAKSSDTGSKSRKPARARPDSPDATTHSQEARAGESPANGPISEPAERPRAGTAGKAVALGGGSLPRPPERHDVPDHYSHLSIDRAFRVNTAAAPEAQVQADFIENRTFDEISIGEPATLSRTVFVDGGYHILG